MSVQCIETTKKGERCKLKVSEKIKNSCGLCKTHYNIREKKGTLDDFCSNKKEGKTRPISSPPRKTTKPTSPPRKSTSVVSPSKKITKSVPFKNFIIEDYYEINFLGKGSFGIVYEAKNSKGEHVVIKKILKGKGLNEELEVRNMELLSKSCNEYFVCFIKSIDTPTKLFIVMEYLENYITLFDLIKPLHKKLMLHDTDAKTEFCEIVNNLCEGLKLMHSFNLSHNDIKPGNIMVNTINFKIKYIDFGTGCINTECENIPKYTRLYFDPLLKISKSNRNLKNAQQGDLWSLGLVVYNMITLLLPINDYFDCKTYLFNFNDYEINYIYSKDPIKNKIDDFLKTVPECKVNLDNLLSRGERTYC